MNLKIYCRKKKALSLVVSYVLLILIGISLSIGVYAWIKFMATGAQITAECPEGTSIVLQDYSCPESNVIELAFKNKGLFNINGCLVKGTDNKSQEAVLDLQPAPGSGMLDVRGMQLFPNNLTPENVAVYRFSYSGNLEKITLQPLIIKGKEVIVCKNAFISQEVTC